MATRAGAGNYRRALVTSALHLSLFLPCMCSLDATRARGAGEPDVLLQDDFARYNPALGEPNENQYVKDNALHVSIGSDSWNRKFYQTTRLGDADATLRVRMPNFTGGVGHMIGLAFWAAGVDDFYSLTLDDSGMCGVQHFRSGVWYTPAPFRQVQGLKTSPGDWNDLRIVAQGQLATAYVNGQKFAVIKGRPPKNGGMIGMLTYPGSATLDAEFSSLKVVHPADPPPLKTAVDADDVIFAHEPVLLDPAWGPTNDAFPFQGGRLMAKPAPGSLSWKLYLGDGDPNMSISAKVRITDDDASASGAGLAFWGASRNDFYGFVVNDAGKFQVLHNANGKWDYPLEMQPVPAAAIFDPNEWIGLKVTALADEATLMINGATVGRIQGKAPASSKFGILASSGQKPSVTVFADLKAVRVRPAPAAPR